MFLEILSLKMLVVSVSVVGILELRIFSETQRRSSNNLHRTEWFRQPKKRQNTLNHLQLPPMILRQESSMEHLLKSTASTIKRGMAHSCVLEVTGRIPNSKQPILHLQTKKWTRKVASIEGTKNTNSFNQVSLEEVIKTKLQLIMIVKGVKPVLAPMLTGKLKVVWPSLWMVVVVKSILLSSARNS